MGSRGAHDKSTAHGLRNLVEGGRATLDPVHLVALLKQELGQVAAVLPCDACDECHLPRHRQTQIPCSATSVCLQDPNAEVNFETLLTTLCSFFFVSFLNWKPQEVVAQGWVKRNCLAEGEHMGKGAMAGRSTDDLMVRGGYGYLQQSQVRDASKPPRV